MGLEQALSALSGNAPAAGTPAAPPETPKPETPAPTTPEPPKDGMLSERFEALARKERATVRMKQELKAQQAAIQAQLDRLKSDEDRRSNAKLNPQAALESLGLTYDEITQFMLSGKKPTPESRIDALEARLKAERETEKKAREEAEEKAKQETTTKQKQEMEEYLSDFQEEINQFVSGHAEEYDWILSLDLQSKVLDQVQAHFNETQKAGKPIVLSIQEAADLVEKKLEEDMAKFAEKSKKFKSKWGGTNEEPNLQTSKEKPKTPTKSIPNEITTSTPSMVPLRVEQDRFKRALAALGN